MRAPHAVVRSMRHNFRQHTAVWWQAGSVLQSKQAPAERCDRTDRVKFTSPNAEVITEEPTYFSK